MPHSSWVLQHCWRTHSGTSLHPFWTHFYTSAPDKNKVWGDVWRATAVFLHMFITVSIYELVCLFVCAPVVYEYLHTVHACISVYSPVYLCLCRRCMECLLWLSEPCCLCTIGRWQAAHWACLYREDPGLSQQTQSSAPRRTGHEEALRWQRGKTEIYMNIACLIF